MVRPLKILLLLVVIFFSFDLAGQTETNFSAPGSGGSDGVADSIYVNPTDSLVLRTTNGDTILIPVSALNYWTKSDTNLYYDAGNVGIQNSQIQAELDVFGKMLLIDNSGNIIITGDINNQSGIVNGVVIGKQAAEFATASGTEPTDQAGSVYIGNRSGQFSADQEDNVGIGDRTLERNEGKRNSAKGRDALQQNLGDNNNADGYNSGQYNAGSNNVFEGNNAGSNNVSDGAVLEGVSAGFYNNYDNSIAIGNSALPFVKDNSNLITLDENDYRNDSLKFGGASTLITHLGTLGHSVGEYVNIRFEMGTGTPPTNLTDNQYQFYIQSADTIYIRSVTLGNPISGNFSGCPCTYDLIPQVDLRNSIAIGNNARPTTPATAWIGEENVTNTFRVNKFIVDASTAFSEGDILQYQSGIFSAGNLSASQGITNNSGDFQWGSATNGASIINNRRYIATSGGTGSFQMTGGGGIVLGGAAGRTEYSILDIQGGIRGDSMLLSNTSIFGTYLRFDMETNISEGYIDFYRGSDGGGARPLVFRSGLNGTEVLRLQNTNFVTFNGHGLGNREAVDISKTLSGYISAWATDGTILDLSFSDLQSQLENIYNTSSTITANRTLKGAAGTRSITLDSLSSINLYARGGGTGNGEAVLSNNKTAYIGARSGTNLARTFYDADGGITHQTGNNSSAIVAWEGNSSLDIMQLDGAAGTLNVGQYGSGNKEEGDLSVTDSRWRLGVATDGTVIETQPSMGAIYVSTSATTTISTANTPTKAAGTTTSGTLVHFDTDGGTNNRLRYTGTATKTFVVTANVSMTSSSGLGVDVTLSLAKNGTNEGQSTIEEGTVTSANSKTISTSWIVSLATNDYVEIFISNTSDTTNLTLERATLVVSE